MNVEFLKDVALAVAQEQHLEAVMKMIVKGIKEEAGCGPPVVSRIRAESSLSHAQVESPRP
jgi:hypothetical protein